MSDTNAWADVLFTGVAPEASEPTPAPAGEAPAPAPTPEPPAPAPETSPAPADPAPAPEPTAASTEVVISDFDAPAPSPDGVAEVSIEAAIAALKKADPSLEAIRSLEDIKNLTKPTFADPRVEAINKFVGDGLGTFEDWVNTQSRDYDNIPDDRLAKASLYDQYPDATDEQIDILFERTFGKKGVDDMMDEAEKKAVNQENALAELAMKKAAREYRDKQKQIQEKYKAGEFKKQTAPENVEDPFEAPDFISKVVASSRAVDSFDFPFGENKKITVPVSDIVSDYTPPTPTEFIGRFLSDDESFDVDAFAQAVTLLDNIDKIIGRVAQAKLSEGAASIDKGLKNIAFDTSKGASPGGVDAAKETEQALNLILS